MEIVYLGHSSFRIKGKSATIVTDPFDTKAIGLKYPKVEADIITLSHGHADHNSKESVGGESPKVIDGPGEYEIGGVSIFGIPSFHDDKNGSERGPNTIYSMSVDGVNLCHLGDLGHKLSEEQVGEIGAVDILLVPVGGFYTIDAEGAANVVSQLEPKIIIPMHYKAEGLTADLAGKLAPVEDFVKEIGLEPIRDSKFVITYDKIPEEMQLVVLERKA